MYREVPNAPTGTRSWSDHERREAPHHEDVGNSGNAAILKHACDVIGFLPRPLGLCILPTLGIIPPLFLSCGKESEHVSLHRVRRVVHRGVPDPNERK
jgi:hypothetical protein